MEDQDLNVKDAPRRTKGRDVDADKADLLERFVDQLYETVPELAVADRARVEAFVERLRREFGGGEIYIRKRVTPARRERALELFNGRNASEVARELGVSRATVYRLLKTPG